MRGHLGAPGAPVPGPAAHPSEPGGDTRAAAKRQLLAHRRPHPRPSGHARQHPEREPGLLHAGAGEGLLRRQPDPRRRARTAAGHGQAGHRHIRPVPHRRSDPSDARPGLRGGADAQLQHLARGALRRSPGPAEVGRPDPVPACSRGRGRGTQGKGRGSPVRLHPRHRGRQAAASPEPRPHLRGSGGARPAALRPRGLEPPRPDGELQRRLRILHAQLHHAGDDGFLQHDRRRGAGPVPGT